MTPPDVAARSDAVAMSIDDVVQEVVEADVAAYGVGWPDKVPPPEIPVPGWIPVGDPGGATLQTPTVPVNMRLGLPLWLVALVVAILVAAGIGVFATRPVTPSNTPAASASSTPTPCGQTLTAGTITAVFVQETFSTTYKSTVRSAGCGSATLQWSGPDCGVYQPQNAQTMTGSTTTATMVWQHPHPPCDPTTDHANVTVVLTITYSGGSLVCRYQGAASGTGPPCARR